MLRLHLRSDRHRRRLSSTEREAAPRRHSGARWGPLNWFLWAFIAVLVGAIILSAGALGAGLPLNTPSGEPPRRHPIYASPSSTSTRRSFKDSWVSAITVGAGLLTATSGHPARSTICSATPRIPR